MCVSEVYVYAHTFVCRCSCQRLTAYFPLLLITIFLRQCLSLNVGLTFQLDQLASELRDPAVCTLPTLSPHPPAVGLQAPAPGIHMVSAVGSLALTPLPPPCHLSPLDF